jgi:hypothetical protein
VYLKTKALRTGDEHYNRAARFWTRVFGINFALGVVTGIPMEFQFGEKKLGHVGHWWAAFLVFLGAWLASGAKRGLCDDGAQRQGRSLWLESRADLVVHRHAFGCPVFLFSLSIFRTEGCGGSGLTPVVLDIKHGFPAYGVSNRNSL